MKNAIANTPTAPAEAQDVNEILNALEVWINQRPRLDFRNYGDMKPYRAEIRNIAADKKRAMKALADVRRSITHDYALLMDSFRAFSGRLTWVSEPCNSIGVTTGLAPAHLEYTTGQYWPTEYRKAAACVLESYKAALAQKWAAEHPQKFTFASLADVKAANQAIGNHWFDRSTMRFFSTRIETKLLTRGSSGRQFFITSEQFDANSARKYTIREALEDGTIATYGAFHYYLTLQEARDAVVGIS